MSLIATRYATALFEVAQEKNALDDVQKDLSGLAEMLADPAVGAVLLSPDTAQEVRSKAFDKILQGAHELTRNALQVILRRRRELILPDLSDAFAAQLRASRNQALGVVETAKPLDDAGLKALEEQASKLCGKEVTLEVRVDQDLIGGVRIRVGDDLYDGSVATALQELERRLMETPV